MPTISIPSKETKKWRGIYPGEFFGNILQGFNIDLEKNEGTIHIAEKMNEIITSNDDAQLGLPTSFLRTNASGADIYWARAGDVLFKTASNSPESAWTQDAIANTPTALINGDGNLLEYVDDMFIPTGTNIAQLSGGTWDPDWWTTVAGGSALQVGKYHGSVISPVAEMLIADGRFINSWDGATSTDPRITLPTQYEITHMKTIGNVTVVATKTLDETEAMVFHYDGIGLVVNSFFPTGTNHVLKIFTSGGRYYIITKEGQIRVFDGVQYVELRINADTALAFPLGVADTLNIGEAESLEGKIGIMVGIDSTASVTMFEGIWIFDPVTLNLYPRYALSTRPQATINEEGGHFMVNEVGGFLETRRGVGRLLAGGRLWSNFDSTTMYVINTSLEAGTTSARAWFVLPKIASSDVKDFWQRVTSVFEKMHNSSDRIIVKYKVEDDSILPQAKQVTWTDTTKFTVPNSDALSVGNEVFITAGPHAGLVAHIIDITGTTITIDETISNTASTGSMGIFDSYIKLGTISDQTIQTKLFNIIKRSSFLKLKFELRGTSISPEFQSVIIKSIPKSV